MRKATQLFTMIAFGSFLRRVMKGGDAFDPAPAVSVRSSMLQ